LPRVLAMSDGNKKALISCRIFTGLILMGMVLLPGSDKLRPADRRL
jgi:hypothetical protein